jgi:homoserine O-succinyltransferase/O-acetyltransferase
MPLLLDERFAPAHWSNSIVTNQRRGGYCSADDECVRVALVNNMPDAAIEDTEAQFFGLLDAAADDLPVFVELFSLPNICRGERAQEHLNAHYKSTQTLLDKRFDAAIITGTEPKQPDLRQEPYWDVLTELFEWAEENTFSTVLSCLAAHAGVLFSDGISRRPIGFKRFGVFEQAVLQEHALTLNAPRPIRIPHSRWNELDEHALRFAGYSILTRSAEAGVDLFVKQKKQSLFVHFQGHPEYGAKTLFKEYRRDVRRFLRKERETYPNLPKNYFDNNGTNLLNAFQESALSHAGEELMEQFPEAQFNGSLQATWRDGAVGVYRNWLQYVRDMKVQAAGVRPQAASSAARVAQLGS